MAKIIPISEHFQHFLAEMKESFWAICTDRPSWLGKGFSSWNRSASETDFRGCGRYERAQNKRRVYRNGYYERDFVTRFGTIRLRIPRTREKSFSPSGLERFQRRAEEVSVLIREMPLAIAVPSILQSGGPSP